MYRVQWTVPVPIQHTVVHSLELQGNRGGIGGSPAGRAFHRTVTTLIAVQSSSRSLVVGWSAGRLVGLLVCWSLGVCEKVTFRVSDGN